MVRRVGVLLCGCGAYDGSDVQESVLLLLALARRGLRAVVVAPDVSQAEVVDHSTGETDEGAAPRRAFLEAARVSRGRIEAVSKIAPSQLDALVIPGGVGVVRTLCLAGPGPLGGGPPLPEVASLLSALEERGAPIGVVGLAQVVLSRHRGEPLDPATLAVGAREVREDRKGLVLFTPGFMASESIAEAAEGIERLADALARKLGVVAG